ncbi:MAG: hypothetical protein ABIZ80_05920 [Bryobacteraceae bacterium]
MTSGFYSPLPPARSGVADYAAALLPALRERGTVLLGAPGDVALYHIANNVLHREIYARALAEPGVCVLHDALLQHLFMGTLSETEYISEFVYNYGAWTREMASDLWRGRAASGMRPDYYRYPMLKRLAERSRAIIVHNPAAARLVREHAPEARIVEIPHFFAGPPPPSPAEVLRFRQSIGIPACSFVYGLFGYLRESKRVGTVARAFASVHAQRPDTTLLIAGEFFSQDLARSMEPVLQQPGIVRIGHMTESEFWLAASATDLCVNLRYPSAGETSGITIRMMGLGKPVLATVGEEVARLPEPACVRVDWGASEQEMLADYMLWFRLFPDAARQAGQLGREHIEAQHSLGRVAGLFWDTLCKFA